VTVTVLLCGTLL